MQSVSYQFCQFLPSDGVSLAGMSRAKLDGKRGVMIIQRGVMIIQLEMAYKVAREGHLLRFCGTFALDASMTISTIRS